MRPPLIASLTLTTLAAFLTGTVAGNVGQNAPVPKEPPPPPPPIERTCSNCGKRKHPAKLDQDWVIDYLGID
ncbi:hypothetical protein TYRP_006805 [Tyrophagus putrescentiae]|nr:hypothetical protein TYRP_006805 [Tyrophagus putrescentiae]